MRKKKKMTLKTTVAEQLSFFIVVLTLGLSLFYTNKEHRALLSMKGKDTYQFVRTIAHPTHYISQRYDLYNSVMMAQAILESNNGKSALSKSPDYNYFGIKGKYKHQSVTYQTWEDDGFGNPYQINAAFKSYRSQINAFKDYATLLQLDRYQHVRRHNSNNYQEATATLTGNYATDTAYNTKLNHIIKSYHLYLFDYYN